jgi:cytochrome c oxidase cbb3-type subunit 1
MPRLVRSRLALGPLVYIACFFWNAGLVAGSIGLMYGGSTGLEWLEMPYYAVVLIVIAFALIAVTIFATLMKRQVRHLYVSNWYLLAAFIWFPLLYIAANLPIYRGVTEAAMNWWFAHNVLGLWFTPVGLAVIYYLIPKITGRPVYSYYLSILGFWTLALFYNWNGIHHLIGGPLPSWLITTSITTSLLMAVPVIVVAINHHFTIFGSFKMLKESPALRFIVYGGMSYTFVSLQGSTQALRSVNEVVHFTHYVIAHAHIGLYAFFTMVLFGSYYYILPRLTGMDFKAKKLIKLHFWSTAIGILFYWVSLQIGGVLQGFELNNPDNAFIQIVVNTKPWLWMRAIAGCIITVGHFTFIWIYFRYRMEAKESLPRIFGLISARRALA